MSMMAKYPPCLYEIETHGSAHCRSHVAACGHPGCGTTVSIRMGRRRKPPSVVHKSILNHGWLYRKGHYFCKEHGK